MSKSYNHPDCPRCKGQGFYLRRHGHGYYRDGSFGHNDWADCDCHREDDVKYLPKAVEPKGSMI